MNIAPQVLDVLSNAAIEANALRLTGQLDRPLYVATNKVLELAGGKWNRKASAHLFQSDASEIMDQIILTGKICDKQQELGYFPTPKKVVARLMEIAQISPGMRVLEPSAGQGAILDGIREVPCAIDSFELEETNAKFLSANYGRSVRGDFLSFDAKPIYDRVVMNPPFARQSDIKHVMHAFGFLKEGGRLVSVMSAGVEFRTNKLTSDFRRFVCDHNGDIELLPEQSFRESGTDINTVIVSLEA